ncbi:MAG: hypothetical protein AAGD14_18420 [Planctomycetota bacterium]
MAMSKRAFWGQLIGKFALLAAVGLIGHLWFVYVDHQIIPVEEGKVYRGGVMSTQTLHEVVRDYELKTIIDLRYEGADTEAERDAVAKIPGVRYVGLPTGQIPNDDVVDAYLTVISNPENLPALVHCYHGTGRAPLFGAIYRIEMNGESPEHARRNAKAFFFGSSFSKQGEKGRYLRAYERRTPAPTE